MNELILISRFGDGVAWSSETKESLQHHLSDTYPEDWKRAQALIAENHCGAVTVLHESKTVLVLSHLLIMDL